MTTTLSRISVSLTLESIDKLARVALAASDDTYRYQLCGVHILRLSDDRLRAVATDGKILASATLDVAWTNHGDGERDCTPIPEPFGGIIADAKRLAKELGKVYRFGKKGLAKKTGQDFVNVELAMGDDGLISLEIVDREHNAVRASFNAIDGEYLDIDSVFPRPDSVFERSQDFFNPEYIALAARIGRLVTTESFSTGKGHAHFFSGSGDILIMLMPLYRDGDGEKTTIQARDGVVERINEMRSK